jgi:hypothetical protein
MYAEVKKCADNHDIKGLHYIFVDSLDVDPTFEKYSEDYSYCKGIEGFFDSHVEMTPMLSDKNRWNKEYWVQLKLDLIKNFSQERFEHMRQVATVVYSDKIKRLLAERENQKEKIVEEIKEVKKLQGTISGVKPTVQPVISQVDKQKQVIEEKKRQLAIENQKFEDEQNKQRARIAAAQKAEAEKRVAVQRGQESKKSVGITLAVLVVVLIVVIVLVKVL